MTRRAQTLAASAALALIATAAPVAAGCWSAASPAEGAQVEICYLGACQRTALVLECANAGGATLEYANGWRIEVELAGGAQTTRVSRAGGPALAAADLARLTCRDLDADGGCRFPDAAQPASADPALALAEGHFRAALGVDSENVQIALADAGFYRGPIDALWGAGTRDAFAQAFDAARRAGLAHDVTTEQGHYDFVALLQTGRLRADSGAAKSRAKAVS